MGLGGFEGSPGLWNLQGEGMFWQSKLGGSEVGLRLGSGVYELGVWGTTCQGPSSA